MAKVVVKNLGKAVRRDGPRSVSEKHVIGSDGKRVRVLTLDANSESFGSGLAYVFGKNVAKARRENKKRFGSPDRVSRKV